MRELDSDALVIVQRQLAYSGVGSSRTVFKDGELVQIFDASSAVRRSRADIAGGGVFFAIMRNSHAGSDDESNTVNPYAVGALATEAYPEIVDTSRFDLWLLGASFNVFSGTGGTMTCVLEVDMSVTDRLRAFGITDTGASAGLGGTITLCNADEVFTVGGAQRIRNSLTLATYFPFNLRMPRQGSELRFLSTKSNAGAAVYDAILLLGLFPVGMGQDVVG